MTIQEADNILGKEKEPAAVGAATDSNEISSCIYDTIKTVKSQELLAGWINDLEVAINDIQMIYESFDNISEQRAFDLGEVYGNLKRLREEMEK